MTRPEKLRAAWLTRADTQAVMAALNAAEPSAARFVGGCVRNTLRGMDAEDIDIATVLTPPEAMAALQAASIRVVPTGIEHGTVTAVIGGRPFEVTTLRRDVETDGRRAVVAFSKDWAEDAARRDFRMNALYAEADGTLHEPVPGGIDDARQGRVIFIGEPEARLREDYLRILRFFRFNAWYGAGIDPAGLAACAAMRDGLAGISAERCWKELKRTLEAPDPCAAVEAMDAAGVLALVAPGADSAGLPALLEAERAAGLGPDPMRRVMALLPRRTYETERLADVLRLSNAERNRLAAWADPALPHVADLTEKDVRCWVYRKGAQAVADRTLLEAASGALPDVAGRLSAIEAFKVPKLPVSGEDVLATGRLGPEVGAMLARLEEAWIESDFTLSRQALLRSMPPG